MNVLIFLSASDTNLADAALYALVGFVIVLSVLALLVAIFYATGAIFRTKALSKEKLFERKPKKQKTESSVEPQSDTVEDDEELFAVISAVISAVYDSEKAEEKPDFVIRRVTRKK